MASGKKSKHSASPKERRTEVASVQRVPSADGSNNGIRDPTPQDLWASLKYRIVRDDPKTLAAVQRRHERGFGRIDKDGYWVEGKHRWKVPYGVRCAFHERLTYSMIVSQYPFYVTWISPRTGQRLRKQFMSLGGACQFICTKAQYADPEASVVVKLGFHIPTKLMGKFPRVMGDPPRTYYWCPRCMQPRRFRRTGDYFYDRRKFPATDRYGAQTGDYIWKEVKLALLSCSVCHIDNRDSKWRPSNQPVTTRKFKPGVRRARRR